MNVEKPDISHWLIEGSKSKNGTGLDLNWLNGDALAVITAGSDTVALSLVFIFYELARHPEEQVKLLTELKAISADDFKALQSLSHLNGFINEVFRLHPAVPTGGYRITGPQGLTVAGQHLPPDVIISGPRYSLGRSTKCFENPGEFLPERWYSKPQLIKDKRGFSPFSQGSLYSQVR